MPQVQHLRLNERLQLRIVVEKRDNMLKQVQHVLDVGEEASEVVRRMTSEMGTTRIVHFQADAIRRSREIAMRAEGQLGPHGRNGQIRESAEMRGADRSNTDEPKS